MNKLQKATIIGGLAFGLVGLVGAPAFATESPSPSPSESSAPDPTATLSCTSFSEGANSATAVGSVVVDPGVSKLVVTFEVDTVDGAYVGTQNFTSSGNYSITVPEIPATTQAQLLVFGVYTFGNIDISANTSGNCSTDNNVTIGGPVVTPTPTPTPTVTPTPTPTPTVTPTPTPTATTPPVATTPPTTTAPPVTTVPVGKKSVPKARTDGFEIAQNEQIRNEVITVGGILAVLTAASVFVYRRFRKSGASS
jgi:hypothetical protein